MRYHLRGLPDMDTHAFFRLVVMGILAWFAILAWRRKDHRAMIDPLLIVGAMAALFIPDTWPGLRYGLAGAALVIVMVRSVKRDLIDGSDRYSQVMTIGLLGFAVLVLLVMVLPSPPPLWAKYAVAAAGILLIAALAWPLLWMGRLLFSSHRLYRDLKHSRPPREADEKVLGIDLSLLRQPRDDK